jgi:diamine N-acetyltransferase
MRMPFLVGETIYLRPLESDDGPDAARWFRGAETEGRLAGGLPVSEEAARRLIETLTRDERQVGMAVARRADDRVVGVIRLYRLNPQRRSGGYRLALAPTSDLGRGGVDAITRQATRLVLAYAFETLNLNRIYVHGFASDRAARTRYEKVGFTEEGILRQEAFQDGRYEDVVVMGILREEWARRAPSR